MQRYGRSYKSLHACEASETEQGYLQVNVVNSENNFPIQGADVLIRYQGEEAPEEVVQTNNSGQTESIAVKAPPVALSLDEQNTIRPYSEYTVTVTAPGFEPVTVNGTEILAGVTAIQPIRMIPAAEEQGTMEDIEIPDHTLYGTYPPKIAEEEIKPTNESGEIVLSRVVVPQTIVVHD